MLACVVLWIASGLRVRGRSGVAGWEASPRRDEAGERGSGNVGCVLVGGALCQILMMWGVCGDGRGGCAMEWGDWRCRSAGRGAGGAVGMRGRQSPLPQPLPGPPPVAPGRGPGSVRGGCVSRLLGLQQVGTVMPSLDSLSTGAAEAENGRKQPPRHTPTRSRSPASAPVRAINAGRNTSSDTLEALIYKTRRP